MLLVSSVAQSCLTLCDPMDCSTLGFPVYHQLLKLAQTHVHRVRDAIQSSDPLLSPFLPASHMYIMSMCVWGEKKKNIYIYIYI